ncbi:unnamed protein product [Haemonchus placei]|uniref:Uncharacterized protein n=1 Tax=Haemonchus placei TaxID=6290 RepID=A0A0N4W426_HAEPC|nr:unnamed protein product [Haemonchus placei]
MRNNSARNVTIKQSAALACQDPCLMWTAARVSQDGLQLRRMDSGLITLTFFLRLCFIIHIKIEWSVALAESSALSSTL